MERDAKLAAFARAVAAQGRDLKGQSQPYTSVNGNMFAFLAPDGTLAVRLDDAARGAFNARHGTGDVIQYGRVMRGYVEVPDSVAADPAALADLYAQSCAYADTLKPKPTKRKA